MSSWKKTPAAAEKVDKNNQVDETWETEQLKRDYSVTFDEEGKPRDPDRVDIIALAEGKTLRAQEEGKSRGMSQALTWQLNELAQDPGTDLPQPVIRWRNRERKPFPIPAPEAERVLIPILVGEKVRVPPLRISVPEEELVGKKIEPIKEKRMGGLRLAAKQLWDVIKGVPVSPEEDANYRELLANDEWLKPKKEDEKASTIAELMHAQAKGEQGWSLKALLNALRGKKEHDPSARSSSDVRPVKGNPNKPSPIPNVNMPSRKWNKAGGGRTNKLGKAEESIWDIGAQHAHAGVA